MAEQDEHLASLETFNDDYDSPWKEAVEHYFPEFIEFYFPELSVTGFATPLLTF